MKTRLLSFSIGLVTLFGCAAQNTAKIQNKNHIEIQGPIEAKSILLPLFSTMIQQKDSKQSNQYRLTIQQGIHKIGKLGGISNSINQYTLTLRATLLKNSTIKHRYQLQKTITLGPDESIFTTPKTANSFSALYQDLVLKSLQDI